jgi:hypothetical protein
VFDAGAGDETVMWGCEGDQRQKEGGKSVCCTGASVSSFPSQLHAGGSHDLPDAGKEHADDTAGRKYSGEINVKACRDLTARSNSRMWC